MIGKLFAQLSANPLTHRVVSARQVIGIMRMQALHSPARARHSVSGERTFVAVGNEGRSLCGVPVVRCLQGVGVDRCFGLVHPARCFEMTNLLDELFTRQPVQRWHWCAVFEERRIHDDNGSAVRVADNDLEGATGTTTKLFGHRSDVGLTGF